MNLSIHPCLSIYLSTRSYLLFNWIAIPISDNLHFCLSVCLPASLSISMYACNYVCRFACTYVCLCSCMLVPTYIHVQAHYIYICLIVSLNILGSWCWLLVNDLREILRYVFVDQFPNNLISNSSVIAMAENTVIQHWTLLTGGRFEYVIKRNMARFYKWSTITFD